MLRARTARDERGFTLVEVLAASVVMLVGLTATLALINQANRATADNRDREAANNLARQVTETAKRVPYAGVTPTTILATLQAQPGMADADITKPGWQLRAKGSDRRAQTFTITASVCSVDDPKDGVGSHATGTWCTNASPSTPADGSPEDYRKLTLAITPPTDSGAGTTKMTSVIANNRDGISSSGGGSSGTVGEGYAIMMDPLCTGCNANAWSNLGQVAPCRTFTATVGTDKCLPTYNGASGPNYIGNQIGAIPVKAIFPESAVSVKFYIVDFPKWMLATLPATYPPDELLGNATEVSGTGGRAWTYTWDLADTYPNQTPDGYYNIKAVAYDAQGQRIGNKLILSMWLNRFIPDLGYYGSPVAGRNQLHCITGTTCAYTGGKAELELYPKQPISGRRDYDIKDWKFYRSTGQVGCTRTDAALRISFQYNPILGRTGCQDLATPAVPTTGTITYTVRATSYSPDAMAEVEGGNVQPASGNLNTANGRPTAPTTPFSATYVNDQGFRQILFTWVQYANVTPHFGRGDASPDCVTSFRIYLTQASSPTPVTFANRWFRTNSSNAICSAPGINTYRTPAPNSLGLTVGVNYRWTLTSVDKTLNESPATVSTTLVHTAP